MNQNEGKSKTMTDYVIVGAGAAGLYTAYRLLKGNTLKDGDTVQLYEWSSRSGGRICTYTFPKKVGGDQGLYCEFGGMRFATDPHFPNDRSNITEGHVLVQNMIIDLHLQDKVVSFLESDNRLYYLRGRNIYQQDLTDLTKLPYQFNAEFNDFITNHVLPKNLITADNILSAVAGLFAPNLTSKNKDRPNWCNYYATGQVPSGEDTPSFPAGTPVRDIGYWNLLYDQLGDEGFDYSADGTGYTSNVINWNAADAMQANNDYGSTTEYQRLNGGYSLLFEALVTEIKSLSEKYPGSGIFYGQQLIGLAEADTDNTTICKFIDHTKSPDVAYTVKADQLFLAMPRRSLEMVACDCSDTYMLNDPKVKYYLESSIDQPAIKVVLIFDQAWWASSDCKYPPILCDPTSVSPPPPIAQWVGGPTITDLPLRMVYYFGNNIPGGPGIDGGPYVLLASYDDMNYSNFWHELEISGDYPTAPSLIRQPLTGPTSVPVDSPLTEILLKQLAEAHGISVKVFDTLKPTAVYFQDWGQDPFGGGYHGWSAHYNICQVMDYVRAPYQKILNKPERKTYVIGSCYSFDQAWVEGAFCTAESVLQDFVGLGPLNSYISGYTLVCKPE